MIERLRAESGDEVLRLNGRLLASRFDPKREARDWLAARREFIASVRSIFVLGLGCGFHVHELRGACAAEILVLEANADLVNSFAGADRVRVLHLSSARELRAMDEVKRGVRESFVTLTHAPSFASNPEFYTACRTQLLGREWGALSWQWRMRNGPDFDRVPRIEGGNSPLTIHDLEQTELVQNSEERERLLLRALRELVK